MGFPRLTRKELEPRRLQREGEQQELDRALIDLLIDFDRRDLRTMTAADWRALGGNLARFHGYHASGVISPSMFSASGGKRHAAHVRRLRPLRQKEIRAMQSTLRHVLGELRPLHPDKVTRMPNPRVRVNITEMGFGTSPDFASRIDRVDVAAWPDTFWLSVGKLFEKFGSQLRRCSASLRETHCGRLFIKTGRGQYCSPQCRDRARSRKWYHDNPERARKRRRQAHQRKVRQATGPNVRTERRGERS